MKNKKYKNQSGKIFGVSQYSHRYSHVQENCKGDTSISTFSNNLNASQEFFNSNIKEGRKGKTFFFFQTPDINLTRARTGLERFLDKWGEDYLTIAERRLLN